MNKDILDKEAFAQKIAEMEDSGLTHAQKNLVEHVEKAINTHKGKEIDYHRYWKDMYEKEHKLRLEAEGQGYEPYFPKDKAPDWEKLLRKD